MLNRRTLLALLGLAPVVKASDKPAPVDVVWDDREMVYTTSGAKGQLFGSARMIWDQNAHGPGDGGLVAVCLAVDENGNKVWGRRMPMPRKT